MTEVTTEMIDALEALRSFARMVQDETNALEVDQTTAKAIDVFDNAGFFKPIDDAMFEEEARYAHLMGGLRGVELTGPLAPEHNIPYGRER